MQFVLYLIFGHKSLKSLCTSRYNQHYPSPIYLKVWKDQYNAIKEVPFVGFSIFSPLRFKPPLRCAMKRMPLLLRNNGKLCNFKDKEKRAAMFCTKCVHIQVQKKEKQNSISHRQTFQPSVFVGRIGTLVNRSAFVLFFININIVFYFFLQFDPLVSCLRETRNQKLLI